MKDTPTVDYKEMLKRYQEEKAQKTKQGIADIKSALIKWTIIILIAACVFYFVYPKYSFRFPTGSNRLYKANKITGTVKMYNYKQGQWRRY